MSDEHGEINYFIRENTQLQCGVKVLKQNKCSTNGKNNMWLKKYFSIQVIFLFNYWLVTFIISVAGKIKS